ncbi:hypothetical protein PIB30_086481 [Stylosanthes scabra]|uniref:PB1-like domain-containing protein n=1 Tax=Stylosanthes scabra TaxID=79078 RepID=A0ABU6WWP4_9FABA|nr:hypothetical protein [Stylosanthes scabra]
MWPSLLPSVNDVNLYVVPVFHHGGTLVTLPNGSVRYVDGKVKKYPPMDIDFVNWKDLETLGKQIGYFKFEAMYWHEPPVIEFGDGLHKIKGDKDINDMCDFTMMHNLTEIHIYLEHPIDVPIEPEEVLSGSSSSSDSYESAEDEAYKPPPPGYESDDSEEESPRKTRRSKLVSPRKKIVNPKSKRYTGKWRKAHALSGSGSGATSGSGASNGSGFGAASASGSGPISGNGFGPASGSRSGPANVSATSPTTDGVCRSP